MKSFLEEYGFAILAAIVVILLIAMSTPVGNLIKAQIMGMVDKFANTADKKLDASASGEYVATIVGDKLFITGPSSTNDYHYSVHGVEGGIDVVYKADGSAKVSDLKTEGTAATGGNQKDLDIKGAVDKFDANKQYFVEVINDGTGEVFRSNILVK